MEIRPEQPKEKQEPMLHVMERAVGEGAPLASWIVVDGPEELWLAEASSLSLEERARAVVAAEREVSLLEAHRLGFGGAVWLPASTRAMERALVAAAGNRRVLGRCADLSFLEIPGVERPPIWAVTCANRRFWSWQLGDMALSNGFAALADRLHAPRLVIPWPALVVLGGSAEDIHTAWRKMSADDGSLAAQGLLVERVDGARGCESGGIFSRVTNALSRAELASSGTSLTESCGPRPVCALPTGELVARWSVARSPENDGAVPNATPELDEIDDCRWRLTGGGSDGLEVREALLPTDLAGDRSSVVHLPGWLTESLRGGAPAGLLVERFAETSRRSGITLWLSNVDAGALKFLLRLGVPLWVDGPAVPG